MSRKLAITIDCGGSLTKITYRLWTSSKEYTTSYLWMSPEVETVTTSELNEYFETKGWLGTPSPKQQAYLEVENNYYVVGSFAKEFDAEDRIYELKYENALYKVLAAIGVVLQNHDIKQIKKAIPTWIGVLLPWDEYSDRKRFTSKLKSLLTSYKFRGLAIKIKCEPKSIIVRPEGGGIYTLFLLKKHRKFFDDKRIGIVQFGHRNLTGFYVEDGQVQKGESPQLGLTIFLDRVIDLTSGLNRENLLKAINNAVIEANLSRKTNEKPIYCNRTKHKDYDLVRTGTPDWSRLESIKSLATAKDRSLRESEINDIAKAIEISLREYRKKVSKWLDKVFSLKLDYLIFSGGAVTLLLPVLEDYCNSYRRARLANPIDRLENCPYYYFQPKKEAFEDEYQSEYERVTKEDIELVSDYFLTSELVKTLNMSFRDINELSLHYRFIDVFGIFGFLLRQEIYSQKSVPKSLSKVSKVEAANPAISSEAKKNG